jgi:ABC-type multidrug transport system permease subunit
MLGALFPVAVAGIMAPIFVIFNMLFAGFFVNNDNIPDFLEWIKYISFIHYGFMGLVNIEFNDLKLTCTESEYITVTENGKCIFFFSLCGPLLNFFLSRARPASLPHH